MQKLFFNAAATIL